MAIELSSAKAIYQIETDFKADTASNVRGRKLRSSLSAILFVSAQEILQPLQNPAYP